jgi:hypothetical protein
VRDPVHAITTTPEGVRIGSDGATTVSLMEPDGRMFRRRAVKNAGTQSASELCWLVVELDGVRVFQRGSDVIVTRANMYP